MANNSNNIAPVLANRLSRTVPQYLVRLAHEPSVGLHYVALHAQSRAAPGLTNIMNNMEIRRGKLSEAILDTRDAAETIGTHSKSAIGILDRISKSITTTKECVDRLSPS